MPRRNDRATKRRLKSNAKARGFAPDVPPPPAWRKKYATPIEDLVVPTGRCGRKLSFATEALAQAALDNARRNHRGAKYREKRYYECFVCHQFHLTSMERTPHGTA